MNKIIPPFCLVLSILLFVAAFASLAIERPQPSVELHRARIGDDEQYRDLLEEQLRARQLRRTVLNCTLFGTGVLSTIVAFVAMRPSKVG